MERPQPRTSDDRYALKHRMSTLPQVPMVPAFICHLSAPRRGVGGQRGPVGCGPWLGSRPVPTHAAAIAFDDSRQIQSPLIEECSSNHAGVLLMIQGTFLK